MEYQIGFLEMFNVMLNTGGFLGTFILLFLYFLLPIFCLFVPSKVFKGIVIISYFLVYQSCFQIWGSGWTIDGDEFYIKAFSSSDHVNISAMEISFVDFDSQWEPEKRENGAGDPGLSAGLYRLKNNEQAIVFNHYYQRKLLLIEADKKYYLIGHPGIKELYDNLIQFGARSKIFEGSEVLK